MKRVLLAAVALLVTVSAFAQQAQVSPVLPQTEPNAIDRPPGMKPCPMCMMKVQQMFQSQLVPLADGGVLLMTGGKLYKYDANLNLVAQTEVQIDYEPFQMQMQEWMNICPLCKQAVGTNGLTNGQTGEAKVKSEKTEPKPKTPGR